MQGPKVVLIGAASFFFGRQTIWSMVQKEALSSGTLALVDPDAEKLAWMEQIAQRAIAATGVSLKVEASTDRREVLPGADFVILAFAVEGVRLRGVDAEISTRHGIVMCSADTVGPGGIFRTLREVPRQHAILQDVERLCPDAWVVNWVNPTSAMGIAMMRHFPHLKSFALCDGPHNPRFDNHLMVRAGIVEKPEEVTPALRSRTRIRSGGINHFNWLVEMTYEGRDVTREIKAKLQSESQEHHASAKGENAKAAVANQVAAQLAYAIGYVPMCVWHTQEYLPYFQGHDVNRDDAIRIPKWREEHRWELMNGAWQDMQDLASGKRDIQDFLAKTRADHASDVIEAMWAGRPDPFYINIPNNGSITNMADDAYVEVLCRVDLNGVYPQPFGELPRPLLGWCMRVLDEHELAVQAAMDCQRMTLRQAMLASMVPVSIPDVDDVIDELIVAEADYLPEAWQSQVRPSHQPAPAM